MKTFVLHCDFLFQISFINTGIKPIHINLIHDRKNDYSNHYIATYLEPGLPNIYGNFPGGANSDANGAFTYINSIYAFAHLDTHAYKDYMYINFNATKCSSIYGNSNTVQPKSYVVYYIIRIK